MSQHMRFGTYHVSLTLDRRAMGSSLTGVTALCLLCVFEQDTLILA